MSTALARTMGGQITIHLRERILAGTYAPGAALLQDTLAAEFGVSKIPVREALVQLQGEGLVDIFAHRGFQVRPISAADMEEIFRLRLQTEPTAVAEGSRRASDADRETAEAALTKLNDVLASDELHLSGSLNRQFHLALVVPRLQPITAEVLGRLHALSQRYVQLHLSPRGRVKRATREHNLLFRAWAQGKAKQAKDDTYAHIEATRVDLAQALTGAG